MSSHSQTNAPSSSLAELTLQAVADTILWLDTDGRILKTNAAASRLLQGPQGALIGTMLFDLLDDFSKQEWPAIMTQLGQSGPVEISTCVAPENGQTTPIALTLHLIQQGDTETVCAFFRDLTQQHELDSQIRALADFPAENPSPVMRVTEDGIVIYANDGSRPLLDVWAATDSRRLPREWRAILQTIYRDSKSMEQEIRVGKSVFLMLFVPIPGSGYITVYGRDITERKNAEEQLRQALAEVNVLRDRLQAENVYLQDEIRNTHNFGDIISTSDVFGRVLSQVERVAPTDTTVLILGETGTGKELIARALHSAGTRHDRPLVKVNCAALPITLIESELFGHEKGAFTGALNRKIGRFELAHEGTLFLDEFGDLPLELQAKLLRVLQEGEFERLGSTDTQKVDVRVITATNRELSDLLRKGEFREDLFYRLNVFPIHLPPLRLRKADVPTMANHFVKRYAGRTGSHVVSIPSEIMARLIDYDWPGNVRELENVIERALILSRGTTLELEEQPSPAHARTDPQTIFPDSLKLIEHEATLIQEALRRSGGTIEGPNGAASALGIAPSTLRDRIRRKSTRR